MCARMDRGVCVCVCCWTAAAPGDRHPRFTVVVPLVCSCSGPLPTIYSPPPPSPPPQILGNVPDDVKNQLMAWKKKDH